MWLCHFRVSYAGNEKKPDLVDHRIEAISINTFLMKKKHYIVYSFMTAERIIIHPGFPSLV